VRYSRHRPLPPLSGLVDHIWCLADAPVHVRERIVPSGTIEIVLNLHEDAFRIYDPATGAERRFAGAIASGCYGTAFEIDTRAHALVMGVHFHPGGAARLLGGAPPGMLADDHVALGDLWGRQASELRERLCEASTPSQRVQMLEQALVAQLLPERASSCVPIALALLERPGAEVGRVATQLGTSRRRFIETFTREVGMTPKRWAMVRRFQRALVLATNRPSPRLAAIALECGYYDQAHACRDFVTLTGLAPGQLLARHRIGVKDNHVAVANAPVTSVQDGVARGS
jgi:AraC-like DNA-binding protein